MKRIICVLLVIISILLCLSACGTDSGSVENNAGRITNENSSDTIPEYLIEAKLGEYQSWYNGSDYESIICNRIISHSPDKESHTDTVSYEIGFCYKYGTCIYQCLDVFQYYKDSDSWSCISSSEPGFLRIDWNEGAISGTNRDGDDGRVKGEYHEEWVWNVTVQDIDVENGTVTLSYNIDNNDYYVGPVIETEDTNELIGSLNWNETEEFYYDYYDYENTIVVDIPCGYTENNKSYDFYLRVSINPYNINTKLCGWKY